jgi:predicted nuclease with TOPRIM domain
MIQSADARLRASEMKKNAQYSIQGDPPTTENTLLRIQIEQLTTDKVKLQIQITHLTADYGALQEECDYVRNAYVGLKQKQDQLVTERANEIDRENELQHKLKVCNETMLMERERKERAVEQATAVEAQFTQYRTAIKEWFDQGQNLQHGGA